MRCFGISFIVAICSVVMVHAEMKFQETFEIDATKQQLYTASKMYANDVFRGAKWELQNDDKDGGVIQYIGYRIGEGTGMGYLYHFTVRFSLNFRIKDGKARCEITDLFIANITRSFAGSVGVDISGAVIHPFDPDTEEPPKLPSGWKGDYIHKGALIEAMHGIKKKLTEIVQDYKPYVEDKLKEEDDF